MATHASILAWETPWTEEPSRLQSTKESDKSATKTTATTTTRTLGKEKISAGEMG